MGLLKVQKLEYLENDREYTREIYMLGTWVELMAAHHGWGLYQKIIHNLEYLDWLKIHFPFWPTVFLQTLY